MRTQSADTSPDAERVLIGMIRKAPVSRRFGFVQSWTQAMIEGGKLNVKQIYPHSTELDVQLLYAERQYDKGLVDELRAAVQARQLRFHDTLNFHEVINPLVEVFDGLKVSYALGGSLASSIYGMQRATLQLDIVADMSQTQTSFFIEQLAPEYFFHEDDVQTALKQRTPFMLIHLASLLKVVVSFPQARAFDRGILHRSRYMALIEEYRLIPVLSPEDVAALLLEQFQESGERLDDVWYDLLGLLKVQGPSLDLAYLDKWATAVNVKELLSRALAEAGFKSYILLERVSNHEEDILEPVRQHRVSGVLFYCWNQSLLSHRGAAGENVALPVNHCLDA